MKDLENKALEIITKLDALATKYTPEALEMAVQVTRIDAIGNIIGAIIFIALTVVLIIKTPPELCKWMNGRSDGLAAIGFCGLSGLFFASIISVGFVALVLLNHWMWVAVFNPKLALAHNIMGAI